MPRVLRVSCYSILSPWHLLQNVSDLLVRCFCLAIGIGMIWSSNPVVLLSIRWDTSYRSCLVKFEPSLPNMTLGNSKQGNVISWIIFFEFFESAATQEVLHPFGQIVHGLQDALALTYGKTHKVNSPYVDYFQRKVALQWHSMMGIDILVFLTSWALHRFFSVSKLGWLELCILPNLSIDTEYSIVSSLW